jgi:hypothetical protein
MPFVHGFWIIPDDQCTFMIRPAKDTDLSAPTRCVLGRNHPGRHAPDKPDPRHPVVLAEQQER